ncbi:hypothetical protein [Okibacterium endophyticum]
MRSGKTARNHHTVLCAATTLQRFSNATWTPDAVDDGIGTGLT